MLWLIKCQALNLVLILHSVSSSVWESITGFSISFWDPTSIFSVELVQQFNSFSIHNKSIQEIACQIGNQDTPSTSLGMANNVSLPAHQTTPLAGNLCQSNFELKHSILAAKVVNKITFANKTQVIDIRASDHIVCSIILLHSITSITHCVVESMESVSYSTSRYNRHLSCRNLGQCRNSNISLQLIYRCTGVVPAILEQILNFGQQFHTGPKQKPLSFCKFMRKGRAQNKKNKRRSS